QKVVTPQKTADGRAELSENWPLLERVHQRFNVQPRFIVALWCVESNFGKVMGNYSVDFDGDGKRDIWGNRADVLGSIASYIAQLGWRGNESWGRSVVVPAN